MSNAGRQDLIKLGEEMTLDSGSRVRQDDLDAGRQFDEELNQTRALSSCKIPQLTHVDGERWVDIGSLEDRDRAVQNIIQR
ncbi:hypothetical protein [Haloarcula sp. CBA1127]|uniref:hypothetical protein n=1 Tax=Haloarcula sp. CBA1127 TaxID=1765055 RepID=UPI000A6AFE79|nr:hypothetical protein [Haloarcula sp. CBA1127]